MSKFYEISPTHENYWRAVILFGRNVASYKFALAKSLYDLRGRRDDLITLEELSPIFSKHICEHLRANDKQATSSTSKYLDACRAFNRGEISEAQLIDVTRRQAFVNVIDAFHVVHNNEINQRFFIDERKQNKGIRLTQGFYEIAESPAFYDLNAETESRWRLVETAWSLGLSKRVVAVDYDEANQLLHAENDQFKRVAITSARSALNGYQKGKCFYCYKPISLISGADNMCDVDHFFPHMLKYCADGKPIDGVANLVLACQECNRGAGGKFERIPTLKLLDRLHTRNEYLISSHHPLRETLMLQTGLKEKDRIRFLQEAYTCSEVNSPSAKWEPVACGSDVF